MRDAFRASERAVKLDTHEDVENWCGTPEIGGLREALYERLKPLLRTQRSTGFDTHDLRAIAGAFLFEHALGDEQRDRAAPLMTVLASLQANSAIPAPEDPLWQEVSPLLHILSLTHAEDGTRTVRAIHRVDHRARFAARTDQFVDPCQVEGPLAFERFEDLCTIVRMDGHGAVAPDLAGG